MLCDDWLYSYKHSATTSSSSSSSSTRPPSLPPKTKSIDSFAQKPTWKFGYVRAICKRNTMRFSCSIMTCEFPLHFLELTLFIIIFNFLYNHRFRCKIASPFCGGGGGYLLHTYAYIHAEAMHWIVWCFSYCKEWLVSRVGQYNRNI